MSKSNPMIPNIFNFIWVGKNIDDNKESLKLWRKFHPDHIIKLWTTSKTLKQSKSIRNFLKANHINLRIIEKETTLENHEYILQEINEANAFSVSDILRLSILLKEPGWYFDINVTPKQSLPSKVVSNNGALFCLDTENTLKLNNLVINYKILASAFPDHPIFKKASELIRDNFDYLRQRPELRKNFLSSPWSEDKKKYFFAGVVTGRAVANVLRAKYITPSFSPESNPIDLDEIRELVFPYKDRLTIPFAKGNNPHYARTLDIETFEETMNTHLAVNVNVSREIENPSLVNRLNRLVSPLNFFTCLNEEGEAQSFAKIENPAQEKKAATLAKQFNKLHCGDIFLGKNRFFTILALNEAKVAEAIHTILKNNNK